MNRLQLAAPLIMALASTHIHAANASRAKIVFSASTFTDILRATGDDNAVLPNIAPLVGLKPSAPTKSLTIDNIAPNTPQSPGKSCNLIFESSTTTAPTHLLFRDSRIESRELIGRYYKSDTTGKLLLAVHAVVKKDENNATIRGSGKATTLDVTSPAVQRDFKKELDFWLSGKYKKFLKPAPTVKTTGKNASFREK